MIAADLAAPLIEAMQSLGSERFERMHGRGPPCRPRDRDETHNRNHNAREQQCQRIVRCHADQDVSDQLAKRHGDCQASEKRDKDSNLYAVGVKVFLGFMQASLRVRAPAPPLPSATAATARRIPPARRHAWREAIIPFGPPALTSTNPAVVTLRITSAQVTSGSSNVTESL